VRRCVDNGRRGVVVEDSTRDASRAALSFDLAVARIRAARDAIDRAGGDVLLVGRTEGFIRGAPDLAEAIRRLTA